MGRGYPTSLLYDAPTAVRALVTIKAANMLQRKTTSYKPGAVCTGHFNTAGSAAGYDMSA